MRSQINNDIKDAMRAKDSIKLTTLRMLTASIKQREIDDKITPSDIDIITIINKMIKQRRESTTQFIAAGREDLATKEQAEIAMLEHYLPEQLDAASVTTAIEAAISSTNATTMKDMGSVMSILKDQLAGKADIGAISKQVKDMLSQ